MLSKARRSIVTELALNPFVPIESKTSGGKQDVSIAETTTDRKAPTTECQDEQNKVLQLE